MVGRTGSFWRLWGNSVSRLFSFSEMFHGSWPFLHLLSTSLQPLLLPSASPLPLTSLPPPYQALCEGRLCPWVHSPRPGVTLQASVSPLALIRLFLPHPTRWPLLCCGTLSRPHARRVSGSPCARNCTLQADLGDTAGSVHSRKTSHVNFLGFLSCKSYVHALL